MPHPITEPMRQQQQQKIATRLPAPASLLALGPDDLDWDDQYTVTNSPNLAATNSRGHESRISSPTGTTRSHSGGGINNNNNNAGGYSNSAMIFSEDEDEPLPLGSSLSHSNNGNTMLSSLFPNIRGSSQSSSVGGGFTDPMLTSPAYHCFQAENALTTLKQVVRDDGWKKALKHKSGVVVHMKNGVNKADKTPLFKGQAIIQGFSPQSIFYVIGMRRLWDENYEDGNLIENLNETTSLTYEVSKATATSKPRDLSLIEKIECTHDGAIIFACTSVESPRIPKIPGRVRAQIKLQGWILEPVRGSITPATRVTFVTQENMKGWIPGFTKKSLARRPLVITAINDYLQRKADRMRAQKKSSQHAPRPSVFGTTNNSNTLEPPPPATRKPHRLLTQQHASSSQQSFESASMFNPSPTSSQRSSQRSILVDQSSSYSVTSNKNQYHSSTQRKHITFAESDISDREPDDVPTPSPITAKQTPSLQQQQQQTTQQHRQQRQTIPSRHLYPSHRHPKKKTESLELLKRLSSSLDDWTTKGENDGVKLYIKVQSDRPSFLRGDGVIEGGWTAEQLCSLVHCYGARKIWDERFEGGQVVERFSQKEYLVQWSLRNMFPVTNCDISAITSIETNASTGTIYTASTSVDDPLITALSTKEATGRHIRGHTDLYGWVFTPNLDERGRTKSVNVTMVWNLDYKCHVPANAAKVMENEMLASVANVRNYIEKYGCPPYIRRVAGKVVEEDFETKTGTYQVTYIAKHEPSQAYRQRKSGWCTDIRVHKSVYSGELDVMVSPTEGTRVEMTSDHKSVRIFTTSSEMEGKRIVVLLTTENRSTRSEKDVPVASSSKQQLEKKVEEKKTEAQIEEVSLKEPTRLPPLQQQPSVPTTTEKISTGQTEPVPATPTSPTHSILSHPLQPLHATSIAQTLPHDQLVPLSPTAFSHISTASGTLQVPKGYMLVPQSHQNNNIIIISDDLTFNGQQLAVVFLAMVLCYYMGKFACSCS